MIEFPSSTGFPPDGQTVRHSPDFHLSRLLVATDKARSFGPSNLRFEIDLMQYLTPIYGSMAQEVREAWREMGNPGYYPEDPIVIERERIASNLVAIADLEAVSKGSALRLFLADGIRNPGRYGRQDLLIQDDTNQRIAAGETPRRKNTLLFLVGEHDWNGHLNDMQQLHMSTGSRRILANHGFGIHIIESATATEAESRIASYIARFGMQEKAFLFFRAHGSARNIILSTFGRLTKRSFEEGQIGWRMIQSLAQQVIVLTSSCEATADWDDENIAHAIFQIPNVVDVQGPSEATSMGNLMFETLKRMLHYGVIYFGERGSTYGRRYQK